MTLQFTDVRIQIAIAILIIGIYLAIRLNEKSRRQKELFKNYYQEIIQSDKHKVKTKFET